MLHVNDLTYRIGDRLILDHASFNLPTGAKVGLSTMARSRDRGAIAA